MGIRKMFENIAHTMAKHAEPAILDDAEEWRDGFNTFSIYQVLPELSQESSCTAVQNRK